MNKTATDMSITKICKMLLLPLLILSLTNSTQPNIFGTFSFAQIFNWGVLFGASIICVKYNKKYLILIALIILFKILSIIMPFAVSLYVVAYGFLIAVASSILFFLKRTMIYHQLYFVTLLTIILQVLQIIGIWEWPFFFSTHGYYDYSTMEPYSLLYMEHYDIDSKISFVQTRPSGLFSSPTYQSLFIALVLLVHYTIKRKIIFANFFILISVVLSNSKYPIIALFLIYSIGMVYGSKENKLFLLWSFIQYILMMTIYYISFPGLFLVSYNFPTWIYSLYSRVNNLLLILYPNQDVPSLLKDLLYSGNDYARYKDPSSITSGFAFLSQYSFALYLSPIIILIIIHHIKKIHSAKKYYLSNDVLFAILSMTISISYIMMFNIFSIPLYWVFIGGTFLPRVTLKKINMFNFNSATNKFYANTSAQSSKIIP